MTQDATPSNRPRTRTAVTSPVDIARIESKPAPAKRPLRQVPKRASPLKIDNGAAFAALYFGKAAAETEINSDAEKVRNSYLDRHNLPNLVASHEKFLILGPKGTGKRALRFLPGSVVCR